MSEAEIELLWAKWGSERAAETRDQLIGHYLPLVGFLARRLGRHVPESVRIELHSFGALGLLDAIEKFQPDLGFRFETYGSRRIRGAMSDGIRSMGWLPRGAERRASRVIESIVPVDFAAAWGESGAVLQEILSERSEPCVGDAIDLEDDYAEVIEAIKTLPERERGIIEDHYYRGMRLAETAERLGITESRVCQLHRRALQRIERRLRLKLAA